ncbi:MANSC domain-containing protein 1 isoform X2 [Ascaphus truei]|uniref:MANSC domain-containing protein 1 isoform X2 n=1 Tax=Ascaphus truei TaxID=8439 RepID=UPI003F5A5687
MGFSAAWLPCSLLLSALLCGTPIPCGAQRCVTEPMPDMVIDISTAVSSGVRGTDPLYTDGLEDCVSACCAEYRIAGDKDCNFLIYDSRKLMKHPNCYLFNCPSEDSCPMKPSRGVTSFNLRRGNAGTRSEGSDPVVIPEEHLLQLPPSWNRSDMRASVVHAQSSAGEERGSAFHTKGSAGKERGSALHTQGSAGKERGSSLHIQGSAGEERGSALHTQGSAGEKRASALHIQGSAGEERGSALHTQGSAGEERDSALHTQGSAGEVQGGSALHTQGSAGEVQGGSALHTQGSAGKERGSALHTQGFAGEERDSALHTQGSAGEERGSALHTQDSAGEVQSSALHTHGSAGEVQSSALHTHGSAGEVQSSALHTQGSAGEVQGGSALHTQGSAGEVQGGSALHTQGSAGEVQGGSALHTQGSADEVQGGSALHTQGSALHTQGSADEVQKRLTSQMLHLAENIEKHLEQFEPETEQDPNPPIQVLDLSNATPTTARHRGALRPPPPAMGVKPSTADQKKGAVPSAVSHRLKIGPSTSRPAPKTRGHDPAPRTDSLGLHVASTVPSSGKGMNSDIGQAGASSLPPSEDRRTNIDHSMTSTESRAPNIHHLLPGTTALRPITHADPLLTTPAQRPRATHPPKSQARPPASKLPPPSTSFSVTDRDSLSPAGHMDEPSNKLDVIKAAVGEGAYSDEKNGLVAALVFGVVFLVVVIGVIACKVSEAQRRQRYTKLDYLINGMYVDT